MTRNIILSISVDNQKSQGEDYNYLPALQKLRDALLLRGYGIQRNGSRVNAVQSAMMGANDKVYLVELGKQALHKDIVSLYDFSDISVFPNTEDQLLFSQKWTSSL